MIIMICLFRNIISDRLQGVENEDHIAQLFSSVDCVSVSSILIL